MVKHSSHSLTKQNETLVLTTSYLGSRNEELV